MDKKKIKRIIAREGLIIIGFILLGFIIWTTGAYLNQRYIEQGSWVDVDAQGNPINSTINFIPEHPVYPKLVNLGIFLIWCYPFFLLVRFIFWAVRILREK